MKPLRLEIEAFGSFADHQTIDFDALGEHRLFLIHGPTGAGKSTILEAICFALYGAAPGASDAAAVIHLRSQHADADRMTRVVLDFALGEERYRVERTPRQQRPKKRGDGFIEERGTAVLHRWKAGATAAEFGEPLATKQGDVDAEVRNLLGLDRAQFRQVILLPQGEFRRLLEATSQDRQDILSKLFDIDRYADLERRLKGAADRLREELGGLERERQALLVHSEAANEEVFAARRKALDAELAAAQTLLATRELESKAARESLERARADLEKLKFQEKAQRHFKQLDTRRPEFENSKLRLRNADRAEPVAQRIDSRGERARAVDDAAGRMNEADVGFAKAKSSLDATRNEEFVAREREPELRVLDEDTARLQSARERAQGLEALRVTNSEQIAERGELTTAREKAGARFEALRVELGLAQEASGQHASLAAAQQARAETLANEEAAHLRLTREGRLIDRLASIAAAVVLLDARVADETQKVEVAEAAHRDALAVDRAAVSLRLAETLSAGEACPVCGADEHPAPAHVRDEEVASGEDALERVAESEQVLAAARNALMEPTEARAQLMGERTAQCVALEELLIEGANLISAGEEGEAVRPLSDRLFELAEKIALGRVALDESAAALVVSEQAESKLASLRENAESARDAREGRAREEAALAATIEERNVSIAAQEAELPEGTRTATAIDTAIEEIVARRYSLSAAIEVTKAAVHTASAEHARWEAAATERKAEWNRTKEALVAADVAVEEARGRAGFASNQAVSNARMAEADVVTARAELETFEQDLEAARQGLALATEAAVGASISDVAALEVALAAAEGALRAAQDGVVSLRTRAEDWRKLATSLDRLKARDGDLQKRFEQVGALANVASGDNRERVSFQRFVLAAFLDEVLVLATISLRRMSKGRYDLRRVSQLEDRRRRAGLDLAVWDGHTGQERPVSTLSGGESFCAALALALGLAEVVQRHSGGTRLDAIFVDEGFGSLDPESLELALETLVELQSGGRLVGLISHVPELQERIDTRIEVRPGRGGSVLQMTLP